MIESDLDASLTRIVEEKHYNKETNKPWEEILTGIVERITKIAQSVDKLDIHTKSDKITNHLKDNFTHSPPFSVLRLAEVVLDPKKCGYDVHLESGIEKLMNALVRITLVSSSIDDFPAPTFEDEIQQSDDIPLVKILWLSDIKKRDKEESKEEEEESEKKRVKSDDMDVSQEAISPEHN